MAQGHRDFVERWAAFWAAPDPARLDGLSAPDIVLEWPGRAEPIRGLDAWREQVVGALARFPDLVLQVVADAAGGDTSFIAWRAAASVGGRAVHWEGVDRMELRDGLVARSVVVFDTAALRAPAAG
ncbi:nuclear transport factor 2 family protein [Kitasatospora sp. DSM 101779]|uniref:nuclear transport factor 2 family protein n=1 Tax=Kitasatospora sp. DSM 101779 TaxID=2853165 RepID=UPI0021D8E529|nr:nuclear transport factor 2 family protein [Kitasatospora sp. DSM 101779]MCU7824076.1 nuclear transport factor 2 family protein [Kitasatospora sp. DSM 101779]